jgi:ribonucleoside-triphosphate reductase (formate)
MSDELITNYINKSSWEVKENANAGYSLSGLQLQLAEKGIKEYLLQKVYNEEINNAYKNNYIYIHDLGMGLTVYCMGHDLKEVLEKGIIGVSDKITSAPPKHLRSALNQMVNYLFMTQSECYDKETQVLTIDGWKYFKEMSYSDKVCTLNTKTKEIEYQFPLNIIQKYSEKIINFKNKKFDISVTPNHELLVQNTKNELIKIKAKDFVPKKHFLVKQGNWIGKKQNYFILPGIKHKAFNIYKGYYEVDIPFKKIKMSSWLKFLGMYISEGCLYHRKGIDNRRNTGRNEYEVRIAQTKYKSIFRKALKELPFNIIEKKNEFIISNKQLYTYLKKFGNSYNKFIPKEIKNLDKDSLKILYKYLKLGDGLTNTSNGNELYFTVSKKLADDIQELYMKLGFTSNIYKYHKDKFSWYTVSKQKSKTGNILDKDIKEEIYNNLVYCVTVPNGTLYTRRNDKAIWNGNCAGAQAFNSIDTLLAPFIKKDKLDYKEIKQSVQEFIYSLNVANRVGFQSPFTNITFDLKCPKNFKNINPIIDGQKQSFTYGDCNEEIGMITKAFFEIFSEGDGGGRPFTFPIPTINLHKNFVWDDEVAKTIFKATAKYGIPTFQNFLNSDLDPDSMYSMCCRLSISKEELVKASGGTFGAGNKTGSIGVVTINLPRLAYEQKIKTKNIKERKEYFFTELEKYMKIAKNSLEIKRTIITDNLNKGLIPYIKAYIGTFNNHFSTIGVIGMNEMCLNLFNQDITTEEGKNFSKDVLEFMSKKLSEFQLETGNLYNLEQTPAEGTCYKLAKKDKKDYPKINTAGIEEIPYYTNSSHLPVNHNLSLLKTLKHQEDLNKIYNGGSIVHVFLGEKVSDWINCMLLVKRIAEKTTLPFFDITATFSICPIHGYISGEHNVCPLEHTSEQLEKYGKYIQEEQNEKSIK